MVISSQDLILAWSDIKQSLRGYHNGNNVMFHEFAHQLDLENGDSDGIPLLEDDVQYAAWVKVFGREYKRLQEDIEQGRPTFLREYATHSPPEFFAVATEYFFDLSLGLAEEARAHVHVMCPDGEAKFWLAPSVALAKSHGLSARQVHEIQRIIEDRCHEIEDAWKKHFNC